MWVKHEWSRRLRKVSVVALVSCLIGVSTVPTVPTLSALPEVQVQAPSSVENENENAREATNKPVVHVVHWSDDEAVRAALIDNLLGHFNVNSTVKSWSETQVRQQVGVDADMEAADYVIVLDNGDAEMRQALKKRLERANVPVLWIGAGNFNDTVWGLNYSYRGKSVQEPASPIGKLNVAASTQVYAQASDGITTYPLVVRDGNVWQVASQQLYGAVGRIVADVLHDFLGQPHTEQHEGFIRIEDVHPLVDPTALRQIADEMASRDLPFLVAVIPSYVDPKTQAQVELQDKPQLVAALRYMVERGGSLVMHGYTHHFGHTGNGSEFWDVERDAPIANDEPYTIDKLERGIAAMTANGVPPLAFEPPQYSMSQHGYSLSARYFSTLAAPLQLTDYTYSAMHDVPYELQRTRYGLRVLPETLGYVADTPEGEVGAIVANFNQLQLVRDGFAGVSFHPFLPLERLQELLDRIEQQPIRLIDLKADVHEVRSDFVTIRSDGQGGVHVNVTDEAKLHRLAGVGHSDAGAEGNGDHDGNSSSSNANGSGTGTTGTTGKNASANNGSMNTWLEQFTHTLTWGIAVIVFGFVTMFFIFVLKLRRKRAERLFGERESTM
ncbi:polysaccharide deacetylase family protein [Paenibacillus sp. 481]|uniref:polysaccharide deacetylase family protein n=1 Tax=Paenibacillus sp. 481 TaxID=2835869 RepID=UPI001E4582A0|nr:polysaccharide deacetylase family protein [Paenibacillus sp. 481]UHA74407.1 polysaccharide deacetylase family protein [Paenibacillus sp. 481]